MSIHDHTYYPPVKPKLSFIDRAFPIVASIVVFALIGVLLAWRG